MVVSLRVSKLWLWTPIITPGKEEKSTPTLEFLDRIDIFLCTGYTIELLENGNPNASARIT